MATGSCARYGAREGAVLPFEPRRTSRSLVARDHGSAELLQFPARAEADAWRRSPEADSRDERQSADDCQTGLTGLLDFVMQTNVRTVQAMLQLSSPVRWIELQQRAAQDYMTIVMTANLALVRAMTNVAAAPPGGRSVQTVPAPRPQTRRQEGGIA